jgi:hypothetical protein
LTGVRYFFKIHALDTKLELQPGATKKDVEKAAENHILADGQLMGLYQRKQHRLEETQKPKKRQIEDTWKQQ